MAVDVTHNFADCFPIVESMIDALDDNAAVIDDGGDLCLVNRAWEEFWAANDGLGAGENYIDIVRRAAESRAPGANAALTGIVDVVQDRRTSFDGVYACHSPLAERWYRMRIAPISGIVPRCYLVTHRAVDSGELDVDELGNLRAAFKSGLENNIAELSRSQAQLRTAIESMSGGLFMVNQDLVIEVMSSNFKLVYNIPDSIAAEEGQSLIPILRYRAIRGDYGPGDPEQKLKERMAAYRVNQTKIEEDLVLDKIIEMYRAPTSYGGVVVVYNEVTERRKKEVALRQSEELMRETQRLVHLGTWRWDLLRDVLWWSSEIYEIFGVDADQFGANRDAYLGYVHPEDLQLVVEALERTLADGKTFRVDHRIVRPSGEVRYIYVLGEISYNESGEPVSLSGAASDITERKRAEESARASEERLKALLDIAPEAVITVGADMRIQTYNQSAENIFQYSTHEILGQPVDVLMPVEYRAGHGALVAAFDSSGEVMRRMNIRNEVLGLRKDGTTFPAMASVSKLVIDDEKIFTVVLQDTTERTQAQDALFAAKSEAERASLAKSEFLASMSHDLRTPLNAIIGFADIMMNQYFGTLEEKYLGYAKDIRSSGQSLLMLVNQILDLSAIEANTSTLDLEIHDIRTLLEDCETIVRASIEDAGLSLSIEVIGDGEDLYLDQRAVTQIVLNLLTNAIKFTPKGGSVRVSAAIDAEKIVLTTEDTGCGIDPKDFARLMEPFARGQDNPYVTKQSWGLGLAIVKAIVDMHSGEFNLSSEVGQGTVVVVTLPRATPETLGGA